MIWFRILCFILSNYVTSSWSLKLHFFKLHCFGFGVSYSSLLSFKTFSFSSFWFIFLHQVKDFNLFWIYSLSFASSVVHEDTIWCIWFRERGSKKAEKEGCGSLLERRINKRWVRLWENGCWVRSNVYLVWNEWESWWNRERADAVDYEHFRGCFHDKTTTGEFFPCFTWF